MAKLEAIAQQEPQHLCIFGDPKTGKSELAASAAHFFKKVIWVSLDGGVRHLFKLPKEVQAKISVLQLPDTKEFPVGISTCDKIVTGKRFVVCDTHGQIDCAVCKKVDGASWEVINFNEEPLSTLVVFDHISQLAESVMHFIIRKKADDFFPGWDEFRLQGILINKFMLNIQHASYNCICIAHASEVKMEQGEKKFVPSLGTDNFSRGIGKYFDHIIYCGMMNKRHVYGSATTYSNSILTGSRSDVVIEKQTEERPSLQPFFEGSYSVGEEKKLVAQLVELSSSLKAPEEVVEEVEVIDTGVATTDDNTPVNNTVQPELQTTNSVVDIAPVIQSIVQYTTELTPAQKAKNRLAEIRAASNRKG